MTSPLCDWWLENRGKCPEPGEIEAEEEHGAPLAFCRKHWAIIDRQPHYRQVTWRQPSREISGRLTFQPATPR